MYKDASERQKKCDAKVKEIKEMCESKYIKARTMMLTATSANDYNEARNLFESIKDYMDAKDFAEYCTRAITLLGENKQKTQIVGNSHSESNRSTHYTKITFSNILNIILGILLFIEPIILMYGLDKRSTSSNTQQPANPPKSSDVAIQYINFGHYEQDNDLSNGPEEITWRVLDKKSGQMLVISEHALDCQPFNTEQIGATWETCSLRTWLNKTFFNEAFSEKKKKKIILTTVLADRNPEFTTINPGNNTEDKLFLLNTQEAEELFYSNNDRLCTATEYGEAQGMFHHKEFPTTCWWWLRSSGHYSDDAAHVLDDGTIHYSGFGQNYGLIGVRPAMWIKIQ